MGNENTNQGARKNITKAKKIVIKVGTSLLPVGPNGVELDLIKGLVAEISELVPQYTFTLVTSGAIGFGMQEFGLKTRPVLPEAKQSAAAVGQILLMQLYYNLFRKKNIQVAQALLTHYTFSVRDQYVNAMNTFQELQNRGVIPIVNENDTVAVKELSIGDNDQLAAHVTCMVDADLLILLTDVEGFCYEKPVTGKPQKVISTIDHIDDDLVKLACAKGSGSTVGGMATKIIAADLVTETGIPMIIANGHKRGIIGEILNGDMVGTVFLPTRKKRLPQAKRYIACFQHQGSITIDAGAEQALVTGNKSLLLAGIIKQQHSFAVGDVVRIITEKGIAIAKGKINFDSEELADFLTLENYLPDKLVKKKKKLKGVAVHRNDMVIFSKILREQ